MTTFFPSQHVCEFTRDPKGVREKPKQGSLCGEFPTILIVEGGTHEPAPNLEIQNIEASTLAIYMGGSYSVVKQGSLNFPCRIQWQLYLGIDCGQPDQDPITGVTILKDMQDLKDRSGLLFQVDCRIITNAWLVASILTGVGGAQLNLTLRAIFWPLSGRPEAIVGSAIG